MDRTLPPWTLRQDGRRQFTSPFILSSCNILTGPGITLHAHRLTWNVSAIGTHGQRNANDVEPVASLNLKTYQALPLAPHNFSQNIHPNSPSQLLEPYALPPELPGSDPGYIGPRYRRHVMLSLSLREVERPALRHAGREFQGARCPCGRSGRAHDGTRGTG